MIKIKCLSADCSVCPSLALCIQSKRQRRTITIRPEQQYKSLQAARQRETTLDYKKEYARRAGIEGTLSEGVRAYGLRHAHYIGLAKTHLQHLLTAAAINLKRLFNWLVEMSQAKTRVSQYARLMTPLAG